MSTTIADPNTGVQQKVDTTYQGARVHLYPQDGALLTTAISVTTTATQLPVVSLAARKTITLYNNSSVTVFIGSAAVTTAAGLPLASLSSISFDAGPLQLFYGRVAAGTADVRVLEQA